MLWNYYICVRKRLYHNDDYEYFVEYNHISWSFFQIDTDLEHKYEASALISW